MSNILLINPFFYDFAAFDLFFKPLGLLNISTFFKLLNYNVYLIDCLDKDDIDLNYPDYYYKPTHKKNGTGKFYKKEIDKPELLKFVERKYFHYGISEEMLIDKLYKIPEPEYVFITINFTYHYNSVNHIVNIIRRVYKNKNLKIFVGGTYPTLYFEHAKNNLKVDHIIYGGFYNIIQKISIYEPKIVDRIKKVFNCNLEFKCIEWIERKFNPDWEHYKYLKYGIIRTEKGCPFNCPYCASKIIHPEYYEKPLELIIKELDYFKNRNIKNIAFYDDALLVNKTRIKKIFKIIKEKSYNFDFFLPNAVHLKYIDEEILEFFKNLNFKMIRFGFETADSYYMLKRGNKFSNKEMEDFFKILEQSEISKDYIHFYILIGLPDQTVKEVKYTINYLLDKGYKPYFALYSPIPNTIYFNKLLSERTKLDIKEPLFQNPSIYTFYNTIFKKEIVKKWKEKIREHKYI